VGDGATVVILARVTWQDSHAVSAWSWITVEDIDPAPRVITSVGFIVPAGKHRHIVIAQSIDGDRLDHVLAIPLGAVRRVEQLASFGDLLLDPQP
jgi:hypothetical protein